MIGRRMIATTAVLAAVTAGGVAGALIGIPGLSGASTSSTTATSSAAPKSTDKPHGHGFGHFGGLGGGKGVLDAGAKALKLSTDDLLKKLSDGKTTIADVAKAQGVPVQDVIDAMDAVANTDITNMVNNPFPHPPSFKGFKGGPNGGFGLHRGGDSFGAAAKALGITTDELMKDLGSGKSIADIAKTKGADLNTIITTLVGDEQSEIDAAVKAGHLSKDRATKIEANLKDRVAKLVNNAFPKGMGMGHFGGFGRHGGHGPDGGAPGNGAPSTPAAPPA